MKTSRKKLPKNLNIALLLCLFFVQATIFAQNVSGEKSCVDCHKRTVKKDILHGPVASDCTVCHVPNGKQHPIEDEEGFTLLEEGAKLCFSCHEEEQKTISNNKYVHKPVARGECSECHEVHSSNDSKLIFSKSPDLCYFCHDKIETAISKSAFTHSVASEEGGCITCHSPHSSSEKKILVAKEKTLCLDCHDKTIEKDGRKITNINKLIAESKVQHPALDDGCSVCHNPHASENKFLLNIAYPTGNYAPGTEENYDLCFGCHDTDLLLLETTKYATQFRDGERNLHYLHVNKKQKGRTCVNCHSVHGSSREHLIPETVKFGGWNMPLKFKPFDDGGSCASGCHKEERYTR